MEEILIYNYNIYITIFYIKEQYYAQKSAHKQKRALSHEGMTVENIIN